MSQSMIALELSAMLANISFGDHDAATQISELRLQIHKACETGVIPVQDWRVLIEESKALLGQVYQNRPSAL
jgi:hypothetical protein